MVGPNMSFRIIIEFICGLILISFIGGVMLAAALAVSPYMAIGMLIVFALEFKRRRTA